MTDSKPLILITNDDGFGSPGLIATAASLNPLGDVMVAAPRWQQTSAGRSLPTSFTGRIYRETMLLDDEPIPAFAVEGSPAQVVQHAVLELAPRQPDLVVAGINYGENLGSGITVSGTVGAVLEAATFGIMGLAVSVGARKQDHRSYSREVRFDVAAHFAAYFSKLLLNLTLPSDISLLKLDVPASATTKTPWRLTRVSRHRYFVPIAARESDLSTPSPIDYEPELDLSQVEPDSDIYAFAIDRIVSVSPISYDLTSRVELDHVEAQLRRRDPSSS